MRVAVLAALSAAIVFTLSAHCTATFPLSVSDHFYYELLGVGIEATAVELKRGYRRQAVLFHPDKHPSDKQMELRFQVIAEAYKVLSDPKLRKIYDASGIDGIKDRDIQVDSVELYARIFGADMFKDWVGELSFMKDITDQMQVELMFREDDENEETDVCPRPPVVPAIGEYSKVLFYETLQTVSYLISDYGMLQAGGDYPCIDCISPTSAPKPSESTSSSIDSDIKQARKEEMRKLADAKKLAGAERIERLTSTLLHRLSLLNTSDHQETTAFIETLKTEAEMLKLQSYGTPILHLMGEIYGTAAQNCLSAQQYPDLSFIFYTYYYLLGVADDLKAAIVAFRAAKEAHMALEFVPYLHDAANAKARNHRTAAKAEKRVRLNPYKEKIVAGKLLSLAWESAKLELKVVLKTVSRNILFPSQTTISKAEQRRRAGGLLTIANVFREARKGPLDPTADEMFENMVTEASRVKLGDL